MQRPPGISESYVADFETAILHSQLGKFNILLMLASFPASWATVFEISTMSFVFPVAECDLKLTLDNKGYLNAITFAGMVSSGIFWGYLSDTLGRKKILIVGYLLDGISVIASSFSHNLEWLIVTKFFGGFVITGCFSALAAYIGEFHCSKHRTRVQLIRGMAVSFGPILLPLVAWGIMSQKIHIVFFNAVYYNWNVFLLVCSFPSLLSGTIFIFMPESPKFLMAVGKNEKALDVFKMVYSMNTGEPEDSFWITNLVEETEPHQNVPGGARRSSREAIAKGLKQVKPLFLPPHVGNLILLCTIQFLIMMSFNTFMLWVPQLFQYATEYKLRHNETAALCTIVDDNLQHFHGDKNDSDTGECTYHFSSSVYISAVVISAVRFVVYCVLSMALSKLFGKRWMLAIAGLVAIYSGCMFYLARMEIRILFHSALYLSQAHLCIVVVITVTIDLFPTKLRTLALNLLMMSGRLGSMSGNLIFPMILQIGCGGPSAYFAGVIAVAMLLALLLPNTDRMALQ